MESLMEPKLGQGTVSSAADSLLPGPGVPGLVSVVIPTYNRAEVVRASIESVLRQTYTNIEVVVVDDGSKDHTRQVVESYDERVRYVYQPNAGVSAARNTGFANARGEFIALLDSDDQFLPWKIEGQVQVLRAHPEVGMVWTDMTAVTERGDVVEVRFLRKFYDAHDLARLDTVFAHAGPLSQFWPAAPGGVGRAMVYTGEIFSQMLLGNLVHTSTVLLRRDRLRQVGAFDVSLAYSGEDYEFHLRTCSRGPVALLDEPALLYRIGAADQLTSHHLDIFRARNNLTTVLRWLDLGRGRIQLPNDMIRDRLAQAHRWVGHTELEYGDRRVARSHLLKSLRYRPRQNRTALFFLLTFLPSGTLAWARRSKRALRARVRRG